MSLWLWLQQLSPASWAILGIALILVELATASSYLLWPGLAALLVALLHYLVPLPPAAQYLAFAALSVVMTLVGRRYYNPRRVHSEEPGLNQLAHRHIGKKLVLDEDAVGNQGVVRIGDSRWRVEITDGSGLTRGTLVEVVEQYDTRLVVRPVA